MGGAALQLGILLLFLIETSPVLCQIGKPVLQYVWNKVILVILLINKPM